MANVEADSVTLGVASDDLYFPSHIGENPGTNSANWRKTPKSVLALAITGAVIVGLASGDPETDQALINTAITNAGVGGHVVFNPGETYITAGGHTPLDGQTWTMYSATIQRLDEITGTSSSAITVGPSSHVIDLGTDAAAAGFFIGLIITISDGTNTTDESVPPTTYDQRQHTVTAVSGNNITVDNTFATSSATIGTPYTVVSIGSMVSVDVPSGTIDDATLLGGTLDGNRSNNTTLTKWQVQQELFLLKSVNFRSDNINIVNSPADAIIYGGDGTRINNPKLNNIGGAFFHSSGVTGNGAIISNPIMKDGRQTVAVSGHGKGAISYSLNTAKVIYENIQLDGSLYGGIGGFSGSSNNQSEFFNGYITGVQGAELILIGGATEDVTIDGLDVTAFDTSGGVDSRIAIGNGSTGPINTKIVNCNFKNCTGRVEGAERAHFSGNTWDGQALSSSINVITYTSDCDDCYIDDVVLGGRSGVIIASGSSNITVEGEFSNFRRNAVKDQSTGAGNIITPRKVVDGALTETSTNTFPIDVTNASPCNIRDIGEIRLSITVAGQPAIRIAGDGGQISNNTIRHANGGTDDAIEILSGADNNVVVNNYIESGVTILDSGTSNVITPNFTVAA